MGKFDSVRISIPKFTETLPSNGKKIQYTPFRVGDEKTLLIAGQSEDAIEMLRALKSIVSNCVDFPIEDMEQYDIEYMFLKLRAKSVGETSEVGVACVECGKYNNIPIDLETVVVNKNEKHTNMIKISDDLAFEMKDIDPEETIHLNLDNPEDIIRMVSISIKRVYSDEDVIDVEPTDRDDIKTLVEEMTVNQFEILQEYFRTKPKLVKDISFKCGACGYENEQRLEGLSSFF